MDTFLAIASKRDTRAYADRLVPDEVVGRILDAGRLAGSARNRQPWRFLVLRDRTLLEQLAETVYVPANVRGAAFAIAIVGGAGFDGGRAAQNMMLAAWNEGVVSCPNGIADPAQAVDALELGQDEPLVVVLTFGYPVTARRPESRSVEDWSARADRKPVADLVTYR